MRNTPQVIEQEGNSIHVLVYGTLKKGFFNHTLLNAEPMGIIMLPEYDMYSLGYYPAIVYNERASGPIVCELYETTKDKLVTINRLEGYTGNKSSYYERIVVSVPYKGDTVDAYLYVMGRDCPHLKNRHRVINGQWKIGQNT